MIRFESEKSLENFIVDQFKVDKKCIINDESYDSCISQFSFGDYGIPDLIFHSKEDVNGDDFITIHIVELKNEQIKPKDIAQISRYKTYIEKMMEDSDLNVELKCSLVVPEGVSSNSDACYLINACEDSIDVYEFRLNPTKGIEFTMMYGFHKTKSSSEQFEKLINTIKKGF